MRGTFLIPIQRAIVFGGLSRGALLFREITTCPGLTKARGRRDQLQLRFRNLCDYGRQDFEDS